MEKVKVNAEQSPLRCPFCHDELAPGKEIAACGDCGARQHLACHQEHGACTACGSTNVLVPQAKRKATSHREPLRGSRIRVEATEAGTRYSWDGADAIPLWQLVLLSLVLIPLIVTIPLAIWAIYRRLQLEEEREYSVEVTPDWIAFDTFQGERKRVARAEVGRVQVVQQQAAYSLTIDAGVDRHTVYRTLFAPRLKPPELEWLADAINAWKDQS